MAIINLRGKHAVGAYTVTIVDDALFEELNQYKWKAKPNGSKTNVYAVRTKMTDGVTKDIRMHRVVLGIPYDGVHDIDHINRDSLDNRRSNLRLCSRSVNVMNSDNPPGERLKLYREQGLCNKRGKMYLCYPHTCQVKFSNCINCGKDYSHRDSRQKHCSDACRYDKKNKDKRKIKSIEYCVRCGTSFIRNMKHQTYCSPECRGKHRNEQRRVSCLN